MRTGWAATTTATFSLPAGTFKWLFVIVPVCFLIATLTAGAFAQQQPSPQANFETVPDTLRVSQSLTIGIGRLHGDRAAFLRHEEGNIPSLNPEIDMSGELLLRVTLPSMIRIDLHSKTGDKPSSSFGLAYADWDLHLGPQQVNFARAGLPYSRWTTGARLRYQPVQLQAGTEPTLQLIAARTSSRPADVTLHGDDSFGPFFLGHKNIIEDSEQIFIGSTLQRRGRGPGDGDYYVDYRGGFLYFNKVVLRHERVRVLYQYEVDEPRLSSDFMAVLVGYELDGVDGAGQVSARGFVLRDHAPVDDDAILEQAGYTMTAYGTHVRTSFDAGAHLTNTVIVTQLEQYDAEMAPATDTVVIAHEQFEYTLRHTPVLYQSEQLVLTEARPGSRPESLVRNLDYVINYYTGVVTLTFEAPAGSTLTAEYTHVIGQRDGPADELRGVETGHRLEYQGEHWRTTSWLETVSADYVMVRNHQRPQTQLFAGTTNEFELTDVWTLLGDVSVTGQEQSTVLRPAVGAGYRKDNVSGRLQLVSDMTETRRGQSTQQYYFIGQLGWTTFAHLNVEFKKELGDAAGAGAQQYKAAATGLAGRLPYSLTYTHGDEHYEEKLQARVTLPVVGDYVRGGVTLASQFLYPETFSDAPRTVHSVLGNAAFTRPDGACVRGQTALAAGRFGATETNNYSAGVDLGRTLGERAIVDYQLRWTRNKTSNQAVAVDERYTTGHVMTIASSFTDKVNDALVYRWSDSARQRTDRGQTDSTERAIQASINARLGALQTTLTYDETTTNVTSITAAKAGEDATRSTPPPRVPTTTIDALGSIRGSAQGSPQANSLVTSVRRLRLASEWTGARLSVRATTEFALHDGHRQRNKVEVTPAYRLSDNARLWVGYEYTTSQDAEDTQTTYDVHEEKTGVTFRL